MAFQVNELPGSADPLNVFIESTESTADFDAIVTRAREAGIPVIPAIFDQTNANVMAQVLADPTRRTAHVQAIAGLVNSRGFDGIDLDYENFAFSDTVQWKTSLTSTWPVFLQELKAAMPNKILSVTVPPVWSKNSPTDTTRDLDTCGLTYPTDATSCRGYLMYNWPATIAAGIVDRFRIMVYDWSVGQAGPIAPVWWYRDVAQMVERVVPAQFQSRVQLGVPSYGRNWARVTSGTCPSGTSLSTQSVQMENAAALAASKGASMQRDAASGEMTFSYDTTFSGPLDAPPPFSSPGARPATIDGGAGGALQQAIRFRHTTCVVRRTVWVPDEWTLAERAIIATTDHGLGGIAMWAFGYETDALWNVLGLM